MKVAVYGLWHQGCVTAACMASRGIAVTGVDPSGGTVERLRQGHAPLFEPGLDNLIREGLAAGRLTFTANLEKGFRGAEVIWVTFDTPVDDEDRSNVEAVLSRVHQALPLLEEGSLVLISSQLPVGTTRKVAEEFAREHPDHLLRFAYSPENLLLGTAVDAFFRQDRIVVGVWDQEARGRVGTLLDKLGIPLLWTSLEAAEMSKHALNAFLGMSVAFANEVAALCEKLGVDAGEVERALKSEPRIGPRAYLRPGAAFAGGTLARDLVLLADLARERGTPGTLFDAVLRSNNEHRLWGLRRLIERFGSLADRRVAVFGLAYKPGTSALRRSVGIEICRRLVGEGARVRAFDPVVRQLPDDLAGRMELFDTPQPALVGADSLFVATDWPSLRDCPWGSLRAGPRKLLVLDPNRFLEDFLSGRPDLDYMSVGKAS